MLLHLVLLPQHSSEAAAQPTDEQQLYGLMGRLELQGCVCELRGDENHGQASRPDRILSMNRNDVCQERTVSPLVSVLGYVTISNGLFISAFIFLLQ